jgi:hypothetical protein
MPTAEIETCGSTAINNAAPILCLPTLNGCLLRAVPGLEILGVRASGVGKRVQKYTSSSMLFDSVFK